MLWDEGIMERREKDQMNRIGAIIIIIAMLACRAPAFGFDLTYPFVEDPCVPSPRCLKKGCPAGR